MTTRWVAPASLSKGSASNGKRALIAALMLSTVTLLPGCASVSPGTWFASAEAPSVTSSMMPETVANASRASVAYDRDPSNVAGAIVYARALRELGSNRAAIDVLTRTLPLEPKNAELLGEFGKALTADGRSKEALQAFEAARGIRNPDWTLLSAEGIALDQLGKHREARDHYVAALELSPNNPDLLSNLAVSHSLSGNLSEAETLLRKALEQRGAGVQTRQNLAMVVGLQGRFSEAEGLARADLDPAVADHNIAVMRELFAGPQAAATASVDTAPLATPAVAAVPAVADVVADVESETTAAPAVAKVAAPAKLPPVASNDIDAGSFPAGIFTPAAMAAAKPAPAVRAMPGIAKAPGEGMTAATKPATAKTPAKPAVAPTAQNSLSGRQFAESNPVDDELFEF